MPNDITTLEPPQVDAAVLPALNTLIGAERSIALPLTGGEAVLRFEAPTEAADGKAFSIGAPLGVCWLSLDPWRELAGRAMPDGVEVNRLPNDLLPAVLSAAFEQELARLEELVGGGCEIGDVSEVADLSDGLRPVGLSIELADGRLAGCLWAGPPVLEWLAERVAGTPVTPQRTLGDLPMEGAVEIGMTLIAADELLQTRRHDVLLMDVVAPTDKPVGVLRLGPNCAWRVAIGSEEVTLIDSLEPNQSETAPADPREVRLVFEQSRVRLPAAAAAGLQAGASLPLEASDEVRVQAGGVPIGRGEVVTIAERVGVRLSTVAIDPRPIG